MLPHRLCFVVQKGSSVVLFSEQRKRNYSSLFLCKIFDHFRVQSDSDMTFNKASFETVDFVLFTGFFCISLGIGIFYAFRDRRGTSTLNYYYGGKTMSTLAVGVSMSVTFISAITLIGVPVELYFYGTTSIWRTIGMTFVMLVACKYYVRLYCSLELKSSFQYLELRFNRVIRLVTSGLAVSGMIIYMAIATLVPALALNTVTPLSLPTTIAVTVVICTLYTTMGGYKAVIWTDVIQSGVMVAGAIAIFCRTVYLAGGLNGVIDAAYRGGRMNFFKLGLDPRVRSSLPSNFIGVSISVGYNMLCGQPYLQRWLSCKTAKDAQKATILGGALLLVFGLLSCCNGLAAYAYYEGCDPLASKYISKPDQLIPFLAVDIFKNLPGVAGLFVSAAFCGTLSTISSGISGLSMQILEDFVAIKFPKLSQKNKIIFGKAIGAVCGIFTMGVACLLSLSPDNVVQLLPFYTVATSPILSIFTIGVFMPWIDCTASVIGCGLGFLMSVSITVSAMIVPIDKNQWQRLPTESCVVEDVLQNGTTGYLSTAIPHTTIGTPEQEIGVMGSTILAISPFHYGLVCFLVSVISSHVASLFTGFRTPSKQGRKLSVSILHKKLLPLKLRNYYYENEEIHSLSENLMKKASPQSQRC